MKSHIQVVEIPDHIPGSGKPQNPDQDVSNIKMDQEVPWPIFEYPYDYREEKYLFRKD